MPIDKNSFLHQESMLTPAIAGGVTLGITNTVQQHLGLPGGPVGLFISFLFGVLIAYHASERGRWGIPNIILLILNSLIIFSFALGSATVGSDAFKEARLSDTTMRVSTTSERNSRSIPSAPHFSVTNASYPTTSIATIVPLKQGDESKSLILDPKLSGKESPWWKKWRWP
jgi:hypothetical protein